MEVKVENNMHCSYKAAYQVIVHGLSNQKATMSLADTLFDCEYRVIIFEVVNGFLVYLTQ